MAADMFLSSAILTEVLNRADQEERGALSEVLKKGGAKPGSAAELGARVCASAGNSVGNFLRGGRGISYAELLHDASGHLKVDEVKSMYTALSGGLSLAELDRVRSQIALGVDPDLRLRIVSDYVDELERKLLAKLIAVAYEQATPEQRARIDAALADFAKTVGSNKLAGLSTPAALLVLGNLGGFATYTLMSTVLGALSFGTLGFGAYTFASSLLSVALGPVGVISLAAYGVYKLGSAAPARTVQLAATCAMASQRLRERKGRRG